jgi:transposase
LIYIKEEKYYFQSDIAKKLGRTEKTVRQWIQEYVQSGLSYLLKVSSGGNNTRKIMKKALELISNKILDEEATITSYIEPQLIIGSVS